MSVDLKDVESHFRFGENWQDFLETVSPKAVAEAENGLAKLFPDGGLKGRTFIDVGSGSGLSMLAALRLGARSVKGFDLDPQSVEAAQLLLSKEAAGSDWNVARKSVFALDPAQDGTADVVHSWGVLHHTGAMWDAFAHMLPLVAESGSCAVALYRKTPFCQAWRIEKRIYANAPPTVQAIIRTGYKAAYRAGLLATRRNPTAYVRAYVSARGMSWHHDVHDWLGGYPYESVEPAKVVNFLKTHGFAIERMFERPVAAKGIFGSHCDEFVARRT